jgi:hypothetical protein
MLSKFSISIVAALALSATAVGIARADPTDTTTDGASAPHSPTNDEIDAAETGIPASTDYANRNISSHSPTNDEIDAAERGLPASTDYVNRSISSGGDTNAEWQALDCAVPDSVQPCN